MVFQTAQFSYTFSLFSLNNLISILTLVTMVLTFPFYGHRAYYRSLQPYLLLSFITLVACLFIWLMIDPGKPTDSFDVYQAAQTWSENNAPNDAYFVNFPYQFGLIQIIHCLIMLFHDETMVMIAFRLLNLISLIVIGNILLCFTQKLTDNRGTYPFIFIYSLFFVPFLLVTFVYGDLIGLTFALLAIWFYQYSINHNHQDIFVVCSVVSLVFAIYFRLNSSIFGLALTIYALFTQPSFKSRLGVGFLYLFITVFSMNLGTIILETIYHVETFDIPMVARLTMGLDANGAGLREPGWYNGYIITLTDQYGNNTSAITTQALSDLKQSVSTFISHPSLTVNFFFRKFASMFTLTDFEGFSMNFITYENTWEFFGNTIHGSYFIFWFNQLSRIAFTLICIGSTITSIKQVKKQPDLSWLLLLTILGGISYHMLFEAKSRYVIPYVLLMIPLAIQGIESICLFLNKRRIIPILHSGKLNFLNTALSTVLLIFLFFTSTLPTLYFQGYTDTQVDAPLDSGMYYRYPLALSDSITLTDVSLLTFRSSMVTDQSFIQVDIYSNQNALLDTVTIPASDLLDHSWTTFSFNPIQINPGQYYIQISSNNPNNDDYGIILGNQYTYVNESNMLLNGFEIDLQGNIKIYKNH